jgi:hypothetical protein
MNKKFLSVLSIFLTLPLVFGGIFSAKADAIVLPHFVFDSFDSLPLKPDSDAYWWVINSGDERILGNYGDASYVVKGRQGWNSFVKLALTPDSTPGNYTTAEVSEYETGYSYGVPGKWLPTYGHPVIMSVRAKWSGNFSPDGTGGAVGSSGFWLWNSPVDIPNQTVQYQDGIGFHWVESGPLLPSGLQGTAISYSWPFASVFPQRPVNMQNWNLYTMIWSADRDGNQSTRYFINGQDLGTIEIPQPYAALTFTAWHDNQVPTWEGVVFNNPTVEQSMMMDFVTIVQN